METSSPCLSSAKRQVCLADGMEGFSVSRCPGSDRQSVHRPLQCPRFLYRTRRYCHIRSWYYGKVLCHSPKRRRYRCQELVTRDGPAADEAVTDSHMGRDGAAAAGAEAGCCPVGRQGG